MQRINIFILIFISIFYVHCLAESKQCDTLAAVSLGNTVMANDISQTNEPIFSRKDINAQNVIAILLCILTGLYVVLTFRNLRELVRKEKLAELDKYAEYCVLMSQYINRLYKTFGSMPETQPNILHSSDYDLVKSCKELLMNVYNTSIKNLRFFPVKHFDVWSKLLGEISEYLTTQIKSNTPYIEKTKKEYFTKELFVFENMFLDGHIKAINQALKNNYNDFYKLYNQNDKTIIKK